MSFREMMDRAKNRPIPSELEIHIIRLCERMVEDAIIRWSDAYDIEDLEFSKLEALRLMIFGTIKVRTNDEVSDGQ